MEWKDIARKSCILNDSEIMPVSVVGQDSHQNSVYLWLLQIAWPKPTDATLGWHIFLLDTELS